MNDRRGDHNGGDIASRRGFRSGDRSSVHPPPEAGSIWEGKIQRIQPYGAFCCFGPQQDSQRQRRAWQGLIHISQLSDSRVEKVDDVVDIEDGVWVKVLEVEKPASNRDTDQHFNTRYRIKLSMKDVSQDGTGQDLGLEREAKEHVTTQLETNLNSMIGMGVALDPMERLVLKNNNRYGSGNNNSLSSTKTTFRGGYTLVDDDEGEPGPDPSTAVAGATTSSYRTTPMGRGRGATLPAWMTSTEGPVGASSKRKNGSEGKSDDDKYRDHSDDDDCSRQRSASKIEERRDRKRHKKKSRHGHRRRKSTHDYSDDEDSGTSHSGHRRNSDDDRRHQKRHKSSSKSHRRKDHRKSSSKRKNKKRKQSRRRDYYEKDDEDYRRSRSRRYKSDESSRDNASVSDSCSSYSSR